LNSRRRAGVLLHPTSLPGDFGIGDLGAEAIAFVKWLEATRQKVWQVLPLGPTGFGNSPYGALSAFSINPSLVSPQSLVEDGFLDSHDLHSPPQFRSDRADFNAVSGWKRSLLERAWSRFKTGQRTDWTTRLSAFSGDARNAYWLDDAALFFALKDAHQGQEWSRWPEPLARRDKSALAEAREQFADAVNFHKFTQMILHEQWHRVREEANRRGIAILGDVPIYVAYDSADVWSHPDIFLLDEKQAPIAVAGVPPDYFSETGQLWGNPLYRWDRLAERNFDWWVERIRVNLQLTDLVRLDHFRGFAGYWEVPASEKTAVNGQWKNGPGATLFHALEKALGQLPLVAEDLGTITPDVEELRRTIKVPGMKVIQFGFGNDDNIHLPHRHTHDTVTYTGTHDNDTSRGWFESASEDEQRRALEYLGATRENVVAQMIRAAYASVADIAIVPLQDIFNLGPEARMNRPGDSEGNWAWRVSRELFADHTTLAHLKRLAELTGR
jgi:4-alpha-glucanotransferase